MDFTHEEIAYAAYFIWGNQSDQYYLYNQSEADENWYMAQFQLQSTAKFLSAHPDVEHWTYIFSGNNAIEFFAVDLSGEPIGSALETYMRG